MPVETNATVTKKDEISHGLLVLRVPPDFALPQFNAGYQTLSRSPLSWCI